ncbi:acetolactate synthase-1/2/3 large subunit [Chiayiivirga flava]|uniref:acetolactate synthase n=1 Tax=Chiayiivirga flava TaxID=659595 RepID=A0A7W8D7D5_9GAMM|nr:thiamine pyrophosphate-dependent enzyme [Chiayiivirga flava]MBB5209279.1 acetolactate synthase-1/2/3 large subunit [Chiayiivirga flava]
MTTSTPATPKQLRGADALLLALEAEGVALVFGYPGGAIMPVYDALVDSPIRHILVRHEQAAALAANGHARHTGEVGVCMATSGPGATNLVTGIADAFLDSVPMVAITGQVPQSLMGTDAFQEVDVLGITLPIVKHSYVIRDANTLFDTVREAFAIAREGRPGPVLIDIPKDVATTTLSPAASTHALAAAPQSSPLSSRRTPGSSAPGFPANEQGNRALDPGVRRDDAERACRAAPPQASSNTTAVGITIDPAALQRARNLIANAKRSVLYTGYGIGLARATDAFRAMARATGIPVVSTLKGLGALPTDDTQFLGMLGMHGTRAANMAVQASDLLICIGARFDDRATGKLAEFAPHAKVIHMDVDAAEVSKLRYANVHLVGDLNALLPQLHVAPDITDWQVHCETARAGSLPRYDAPGEKIYAPALLRRLSELASDDTVIACDVGQHQMWVAQHCVHRQIHQHLTSGGLGTMGFGLPAAMGVALARPGTPVVCVSGDGSIMMNIQELATLRRYGVPVKILLLDNGVLGMVRQQQELLYGERYSEIDLSDNPDFAQVARAFGIKALSLDTRAGIDAALRALLDSDGPCLLHVSIDPHTNVWPFVPPNTANDRMLDDTASPTRTARPETTHA